MSLSCSPASNPWVCHTVRIRDITPELSDVATYQLAFDDPAVAAAYRFQPGQFNMLYLPGVGEVPISLSADPASTTTWSHTVRAVGNVTQQLARLRVGETLGLRGPFGSSWPLPVAEGHDVVIVAGGLGLAPLRPAVYELLRQAERYQSLTLLYGARTPDTILFEHELPDWSRRGMQVELTVDRPNSGWSGNVGVVTLLLDRLPLRDPLRTSVFVCGPEVMMRFVGKSALSRGIPESQLWLSMERNMQCAIGLCGHCQLGPTFICKDGPVYRHDQLAPFLNVEGL
ncbi:MAG: Uncharacterized protein FD138_2779 [Planctomycetota bacterium]|nr:MAG: Uncharacterized protein FD138_2779 [Planctomycetota bacterium]